MKTKYSDKPFAKALAPILQDKYGDNLGRYTLSEFLLELKEKTGFSEEYLRLMLRDRRPLVIPEVPEAAAAVLGLDPHYFKEYRLWWIESMIQEHPDLMVRVYDVTRAFTEEKP